MAAYVIMNVETGMFVARPGLAKSYTLDLRKIAVFRSWEEAERDRCGNEQVVGEEDLPVVEVRRRVCG